MNSLQLKHFPDPPPGKTGWPWTEGCPPLPEKMKDGTEWPRISIVTSSYNQGQFIEETIRSVLLQGYRRLEYIVINGGSDDNSVNIITKYEPWITHWESKAKLCFRRNWTFPLRRLAYVFLKRRVRYDEAKKIFWKEESGDPPAPSAGGRADLRCLRRV